MSFWQGQQSIYRWEKWRSSPADLYQMANLKENKKADEVTDCLACLMTAW